MSYNNLDPEFLSFNRSSEEEKPQTEEETKQVQRTSFIMNQKKEEELELTQFMDGEDEDEDEKEKEDKEDEDENEEDKKEEIKKNKSTVNMNNIWENTNKSTKQKEKKKLKNIEERRESSVEQFLESNKINNKSAMDIYDEKTEEIFNQGESESESENEIMSRKRFKKNKTKKRKLDESNESNELNESKESNDENDRIIKKKKKKLTKCQFIDNAAESADEDEESDQHEEENYMLEGEKYKKSSNDEINNNDNIQSDLIKKKSSKSQELDFNGFDSFTEEEYEAEKNSITKLKNKKTSFDEITDTLKLNKKKIIKISEEDALQYCENILNQMILLHEQDVKSMKEHKPMTAKLQAIDEICKILTKPKWKPYFMKLDIYHALTLWLMPLNKNTLPNYSIRTNLLKVIQQLPITMKSLRGSQLGKVMTFLHTHKDETNDNKKLIRSIMQNWMGPIIGINTNYKYSIKQRQKKIKENPEFHKKILEKAKTLIPDSICIEKEEEQNEFKRHATIPYNSECSFLINVSSSIPDNTNQNIPKSKIKRLTDNLKMNKRCRKSHKVSIEGKGVEVAP